MTRMKKGEQVTDATDAKQSNPKDAIGSTKLDMGLVPDSAIAGEALAFYEGALKYGRYNWRAVGVRASIYHAACRRHLAKWWNGEDEDPETLVNHLYSARACLGVLIDAIECGMYTDDRPPVAPVARMIDHMPTFMSALAEQHKDKDPYQYTIHD